MCVFSLVFSLDYPDYGEFLSLIDHRMPFSYLFISFVYRKTRNDSGRANLVCALNKQLPPQTITLALFSDGWQPYLGMLLLDLFCIFGI